MTGAAKAKGDEAEREAARCLSELLGFKVERLLGAGRLHDVGDLHGIPNTVVQVAWWPTRGVLRSVREKPVECALQQSHAEAAYGFSMIRLHGGVWRAVLTPPQIAAYVRETL